MTELLCTVTNVIYLTFLVLGVVMGPVDATGRVRGLRCSRQDKVSLRLHSSAGTAYNFIPFFLAPLNFASVHGY